MGSLCNWMRIAWYLRISCSQRLTRVTDAQNWKKVKAIRGQEKEWDLCMGCENKDYVKDNATGKQIGQNLFAWRISICQLQ